MKKYSPSQQREEGSIYEKNPSNRLPGFSFLFVFIGLSLHRNNRYKRIIRTPILHQCSYYSLLAEAVGFEPTNELPRYRISSAGRYDHFDTLPYFDVEKPLRSGHNRHAVRIAMTTSIHFLIENIYRVSAWFIIVYKIYFCNKFCTTWLLLLTICGFSMPTMLDGRENRRIIIYHIYY